MLTLSLIKRTYTCILKAIKSYMKSWDTPMMLSLKHLQRSSILSMILHLCHVRTVLVLKSRLRTFPKNKVPPTFLAKEKGDRIMFDVSSVNALSQGGNQFW
jgi:hypothetical protein